MQPPQLDPAPERALPNQGPSRPTNERNGSSSGSSVQPSSFQDSTSLLAVYPFVPYTPSSRVAKHLDHLTLTHATPSRSSDIYPQYAQQFNALDNPTSDSEWATRQRYEEQILRAMGTGATSSGVEQTYSPYLTPMHPHHQSLAQQQLPPPSPFLQYIPYPQVAPTNEYGFATPLPPTPSTSASAHSPSPTPTPTTDRGSAAYFEAYLADTTAALAERKRREKEASQPPARKVEMDKPDAVMIAHDSSPSKKRKSATNVGAATSGYGGEAAMMVSGSSTPSSSTAKLPAPSPSPVKRRLVLEAGTPKRSSLVTERVPAQTNFNKGKTVFRSPERCDDDGVDSDWEMNDGDDAPHTSPTSGPSVKPPVSGSGRTGDRDTRTAFQRLMALMEDVFEADDDLPYPVEPAHLAHSRFFSQPSQDQSTALLSLQTIQRLDFAISKVQNRRTRRRSSAVGAGIALASGGGGTAAMGPLDWNVSSLTRILKILERSINAAEDLALFPNDGAADDGDRGRSKTKGKKSKASRTKAKQPSRASAQVTRQSSRSSTRSTSRSRATPADEEHADLSSPPQPTRVKPELSGFDFNETLRRLVEGVTAASCALAMLRSDGVPKQVFSENLITSCMNLIKHVCASVLLPYIAGIRDAKGIDSSHLLAILKTDMSPSKGKKPVQESPLFAICESTTLAIHNLAALVNIAELSLSDSLVIQAVYTSIGPIFAGDPQEEGKRSVKSAAVQSATGQPSIKGLKLESLALLRSIFAKHSTQRQWIIEEVLVSLIRLPSQAHGGFRLRDGRSMHSMSALMLLLVQTCCHGIAKEAGKITQAKADVPVDAADRDVRMGELLAMESTLYDSALESASKSAHAMAAFLINKSVAVKGARDTPEGDYKLLLEVVIKDTLSVLQWPEWPAASLLVNTFARLMVNALDDARTGVEQVATKSLALDHLGNIAAGLRSVSLRAETGISFTPIASTKDVSTLAPLLTAHRLIFSYLANHAGDDQSFSTARDFSISMLAQELVNAVRTLKQTASIEGQTQAPSPSAMVIVNELTKALSSVWSSADDDVFGSSTEDEAVDAINASISVNDIRHGQDLFEPILRGILTAMDGTAVALRTKALKGLMSVITADYHVLALSNVQAAVKNRLLDSSPAVRDAAVELLGKYLTQHPELIDDYYTQIGARIGDTGLGVRKRVIKLLKTIYLVKSEVDIRVDICTKLVSLMGDEDETVKDLAGKTIAELWFPETTPSEEAATAANEGTAAIVLAVSAQFREKNSFLHDLFAQMAAGPEASMVHSRFKHMSDYAIERLMDSDDTSENRAANCIKTVHLLATAVPTIIGVSEASQLLTFLRNPASAEDQSISDLLLAIFSCCIPHLPKSASNFASDLTTRLLPMIGKPSGGQGLLKDAVACLCKVVIYLSQDYARLVTMLKSCNAKLQHARRSFSAAASVPENASRSVITLMYIAALLVESCDFDQVRVNHEPLREAIDSVSMDSISDYMFDTFIDFTQMELGNAAQTKVMACLGCLFRSHPTLMTTEPATHWMDQTFTADSPELKSQLLRMIQDVLVSESAKKPKMDAKPKIGKTSKAVTSPAVAAFDITDLVGSAADLQESGVSTAIVQRYLTVILETAISTTISIQKVAIDILSFTVTQGLAHPLQCLPVIISLETSDLQFIADRALSLHSTLHAKHPDLISIRFVDFARAAFEYQASRKPMEDILGYRITDRPTALFHGWYGLVRDKRAWRQDMLKAFSKIFQIDPAKSTISASEVVFIRFMAENLSAFDYKTLEEVYSVIHFLTSALSASVAHLLELLDDGTLDGQGASGDTIDGYRFIGDSGFELDATHFINASIVVGIVLLLKDHLKRLYGLSEDKCNKFVVGKKTASGDKLAMKRSDKAAVVSWDKMPAAIQGVTTVGQFEAQRATISQLIADDGTLDEFVNLEE